MGAVEVEDLRHLLERSQDQAQDEATVIDQDTLGEVARCTNTPDRQIPMP